MKEAVCNEMRAVPGRWIQWHIEELHELYCLQNTTRMSKSRRKGWVGKTASMGVHVPAYRFLAGKFNFNPLNPELNPICYLLALIGAHHFLHVSRIRVKLLTLRRLMSYIYGAPILDVSRSHTTTQHSR